MEGALEGDLKVDFMGDLEVDLEGDSKGDFSGDMSGPTTPVVFFIVNKFTFICSFTSQRSSSSFRSLAKVIYGHCHLIQDHYLS